MSRPVTEQLRSRWSELATRLNAPSCEAEAAFKELCTRYQETSRAYHDLSHIAKVLEAVDQLWPSPPVALQLAAWFHDAVYDPRASDNEERSADYVRSLASPLGLSLQVVEETARLILLTRTHQAGVNDRAGQVLLDADLSILGANADDYEDYARSIRKEYAWVEEASYRAGRAAVLERFLARPRLFGTEEFHRRLESQARMNLQHELKHLRS
jgi:predicted metal-dependent HD superfamily phosphohydrolase